MVKLHKYLFHLIALFTITCNTETICQNNDNWISEFPGTSLINIFSFEAFPSTFQDSIIFLHNSLPTNNNFIKINTATQTVETNHIYGEYNGELISFLLTKEYKARKGIVGQFYTYGPKLDFIVLSDYPNEKHKGKAIVSNWEHSVYEPFTFEFLDDSTLLFSLIDYTPIIDSIYKIGLKLTKWNYSKDSIEWTKNYLTADNNTQEYHVSHLTKLSNGRCIMAGFFGSGTDFSGFLMEFSPANGEIIRAVAFPQYDIDPFSKLIRISEDSENNLFISSTHKDSQNNKSGIIFKLSPEWNLLWAKKIIAKNYSPTRFATTTIDDGNILFVLYTDKELPVIIGHISSNGNLLWHNGLEFHSPYVILSEADGVYFISGKKYAPDGTSSPGIIVAKTTAEGELTNCPQLNACIQLEPFNIQLYPVQWLSVPSTIQFVDMDTVILEFKSIFNASPYCSNLQPPNPFFSLPDTVCAGTCLQPDSTFNRLAHHVEWHIAGPMTDTLIADTTFSFCFDQPGTWTVTQRIWLLGCEDEWTHLLTVLPDDLH
ncbi:MAG: hypothetical protein D6794_00545, partial [Deltaproteobacteria bacterium]